MTNLSDAKKLAEVEAKRSAQLSQLNTVFCCVILCGLLFAAIAGGLDHMGSTVLWAFACLAVGAFIGLLFGIPRIRQGKAADADSAKRGADFSYAEVNNNLVEVSDWLTKIIVGVGLVQLNSMPEKLRQLAEPLTRCYDSDCGMAVAIGVIIFFSFAGFLIGYINARTLIAGMLVNSDRELIKQFENKISALESLSETMEDKARGAGVALPGQSITVAAQTSPAAEGALRESNIPAEPGEMPAAQVAASTPADEEGKQLEKGYDPDDPHKGRFGGEPQRNGRIFEATIEPRSSQSSSSCWVRFRVRSLDPAKPLVGKVTFFLHPTFGRYKKYDVTVKDGVAEDTVLSWGAFTAGAVADGGATRLELDLVDVPGGNQRFYEE